MAFAAIGWGQSSPYFNELQTGESSAHYTPIELLRGACRFWPASNIAFANLMFPRIQRLWLQVHCFVPAGQWASVSALSNTVYAIAANRTLW